MTKFIKKPVSIEAYQITKDLIKHPLPAGLNFVCCEGYTDGTIRSWVGTVTTIHGQETRVILGDWIVTEPDGIHHYPVKPDVFKATYYTEQEYAELGL